MKPVQFFARCGAIALAVVLTTLPVAYADFDQAMSYYKSGKFLEAASEFQAMVDEHPDYTSGHFMLGICFVQTKKYADAEKSFLKAVELDPDKFEYHFNLANTYQVRKLYSKAVSALNNAEGLANGDDQKNKVYKMRGFALAAQKKWEEAVDDLEKSLRIAPGGPTQMQLGNAYFALGDNKNAVSALQKAVKLAPTAEGYKLLGESLINLAAKAGSEAEKKRLYGEALAEAEKFLAKQPSNKSRYLAGRAALGAGQYDKAIKMFGDVVRAEPGNCNALANAGKAHTAKGDWTNALASLEAATKCKPSMRLAWENMGFVLQKISSGLKTQPAAQQKRYTEAIAAYEKARKIKPSTSIENAIRTCRENIKISQENQGMDQAEAAQKAAEEQANREFEEARRKEEAWKRKQDDD